VKNTVAGWGGATKDQIGRMVQQRLSLDTIPQPADAADAAAIALCHCSIAPFIASRDAAVARGIT
jgi:crossover junction endodeoxyribonuclease RuvC